LSVHGLQKFSLRLGGQMKKGMMYLSELTLL
jgi:hypothetical protein